jgi:hypothetical protein
MAHQTPTPNVGKRPPTGLRLFQMAGQGRNGFRVVDLFDSEEAIARFNEALGSIPREVGIEEPPDFFPVHTVISARRVRKLRRPRIRG